MSEIIFVKNNLSYLIKNFDNIDCIRNTKVNKDLLKSEVERQLIVFFEQTREKKFIFNDPFSYKDSSNVDINDLIDKYFH